MAAKLLSDLASGVTCVPSNYVRPVHDRPSLDQVQPSDHSIPLINLHGFDGSRCHEIINQIGLACQNYGFFQVQNHAIEDAVIDNMLKVAREFFHLPESERLKCFSEDPLKTTRLSTSFNVKTEEVSSWRDYLRLHCYPLEDYMHEWPSNPPSFREDVAEYCRNVKGLAERLLEAISESLGLEKDYRKEFDP
ncbi:protein DMR6-LIKE OXYGENASE 1-like [Prunus dulcis]|uniref:protein DMR6-LIKE OXYGENASE 1-like n=1 Tax=Prunus dulcis TaxID=3755 RepID=UPI0014832AF8|nr:protein DMR6-LIKE OXYGENASE 1-like [Prunus dulcis]